MAGHTDSDSSEVERIVSMFFSKCIHVILQSRYTNAAYTATSDKWFNLLLREDVPPNFIHNNCASSSGQLVVDLVLLHPTRHKNGNGNVASAPSYESSWRWDGRVGRVIERWVMMIEGNKQGRDSTGRSASKSKTFYKKCVIMLRSVCLMLKLLPAYKLFRDLKASPKPSEFSIGHRISSFTELFTREEEAQMQKYLFNPIESSCGSLSLSVLYLSSLPDRISEPSYHMMLHIVIPDYFGRVSVDPVCNAPRLHGNRMVTYGPKPPGNGSRKPLTTDVTQAQLPTFGEEPWDEVSFKRKLPTAEAASSTSPSCGRSHSFDAPSHPAKTPPHAARRSSSLDNLRFEVCQGLSLEEVRDPFQPRLSDNAVLGSMFSIFNAAAPLRQASAFTQTKSNPQGVSVTVPTKRTVKTTSDALRELQDLIELKERILQKRSSTRTPNIASLSASTK